MYKENEMKKSWKNNNLLRESKQQWVLDAASKLDGRMENFAKKIADTYPWVKQCFVHAMPLPNGELYPHAGYTPLCEIGYDPQNYGYVCVDFTDVFDLDIPEPLAQDMRYGEQPYFAYDVKKDVDSEDIQDILAHYMEIVGWDDEDFSPQIHAGVEFTFKNVTPDSEEFKYIESLFESTSDGNSYIEVCVRSKDYGEYGEYRRFEIFDNYDDNRVAKETLASLKESRNAYDYDVHFYFNKESDVDGEIKSIIDEGASFLS